VKRLRRILLNAASVLSLVLCVAAVGLWLRSYWRTDRWRTDWHGSRYVVLAANRGTFYLTWTLVDANDTGAFNISFAAPPGFSTTAATTDDDDESSGLSSFLGFKWLFSDFGPMSVRTYGVPAWFLVALTATPALIALHRIRRRRREANRRGLCPACGYDLRATPDRCPECGAVPIAQDASSTGRG
jgi:hypothetical protein